MRADTLRVLGGGKIRATEQNVRAYFMLSHRIRDIILLEEKITSKIGFSSPSARKPVKRGFCSAIHNNNNTCLFVHSGQSSESFRD